MFERLAGKAATHLMAVVVGAAMAIGAVFSWYSPSKSQTLFRIVERPYVADMSDLVRDVPSTSIPVELKVLTPTKKQEKKLEKKIGGELPAGKLLSVNEIKALCDGGWIVVSLPEIVVGEEGNPITPEVTIYPGKKKFFQLVNEWEVGLGYGLYTVSEINIQGLGRNTTRSAYHARVQYTPFRVGRLYPSFGLIKTIGTIDQLSFMVEMKVVF